MKYFSLKNSYVKQQIYVKIEYPLLMVIFTHRKIMMPRGGINEPQASGSGDLLLFMLLLVQPAQPLKPYGTHMGLIQNPFNHTKNTWFLYGFQWLRCWLGAKKCFSWFPQTKPFDQKVLDNMKGQDVFQYQTNTHDNLLWLIHKRQKTTSASGAF